jgi:hypothetical protein
MRKILLLGSAFLLSTSAFALSVPAGRHLLGAETADSVSRVRDGFVLASEHGEAKRGNRDQKRYAEDDEDDDDDEGGGMSQPRAADPNAPVPDNGLFKGQARPKVEVQ